MNAPRALLLVEDDDVDAAITRRSLSQLGIDTEFVRTNDGQEAIDYLIAFYDDLPCMILLDLNMPRMNGFEFLRHVKADDRLKDIPVLVLSTSTAQSDREMSLKLGAAEYIVKGMDASEFVANLKVVERFCPCHALPNQAPRQPIQVI
jgi:CheY-like chemotaxis protein